MPKIELSKKTIDVSKSIGRIERVLLENIAGEVAEEINSCLFQLTAHMQEGSLKEMSELVSERIRVCHETMAIQPIRTSDLILRPDTRERLLNRAIEEFLTTHKKEK